MIIRLTQSYTNSIKTTGKPFWITDEGFNNLRLYVGASGIKTWYVSFWKNNSKQSYKIGSASVVTVAEARVMARDFLARLARGEEPEKKAKKKLRFKEFIEIEYKPWVEVHRITGKETIYILTSAFSFLLEQPIEEITINDLEKWRTKRREDGAKAATINRQIAVLKAALNWGVKQEIIEANPLARIERLKESDSVEKVRYLTTEERERLMSALDEREERLKVERASHNKWLSERRKEPFPSLYAGFADYLKPMVLISLNSGIRRGSLFALTWGDVDFVSRTITLRASTTKAGKVQRISMNKTIYNTLTTWREQSENTGPGDLLFPSPKKKGAIMDNTKRSWETLLKAAKIENFRWHDMRHDFASQLAMKGASLNDIRAALGHSDMKMTMRYAHLSPENERRTVELLD